MPPPPPILLVHGAFSCPAHLAAWSAYFTEAGYQCHTPALPGHDPFDPVALSYLNLSHYLAALLALHGKLATPPIVIGHSMGGLLAQRLAAVSPCSALVCVASAPPRALQVQLRSLPYLIPLFPRILAGLPIQPSGAAVRCLALHDLPQSEKRDLEATLGVESGRACRAMFLGVCRVRKSAIHCPVLCVSGGEDRIISRRTARFVAERYSADHIIFNTRGHWLIASSGVEEVAGSILRWLHKMKMGTAATAAPNRQLYQGL
jgi:pimeloyl-ACP methyl ester carboxylesterase